MAASDQKAHSRKRRNESYNPLLKSYPDSEKVNAVSEGAELLYVRLVAKSDDCGRFWGSADWILAKLFTARALSKQVSEREIEKRLKELERVGLIVRYEVAGRLYLQMVEVVKRLRSDITPDIRFPEQLTESVTDAGRERNGDETGDAALRDRPGDVTDAGHQPNPTQIQPNPTQPSKGARPGAVPFPFALDTPDFRSAWSDWEQHRREIKKPLTPTSTRQQFAQLESLGVKRAIAAIRHSIANGWQGIFEPDKTRAGPPRTGPGQIHDPEAAKKDPNYGKF